MNDTKQTFSEKAIVAYGYATTIFFIYMLVTRICVPYMQLLLSSFMVSITPVFSWSHALWFALSVVLLWFGVFIDDEKYLNEYSFIWMDNKMNILTRNKWGKKTHSGKAYDFLCRACFFMWSSILIVFMFAFVGYWIYCATVAFIAPFLNLIVASTFKECEGVRPFAFVFRQFEMIMFLGFCLIASYFKNSMNNVSQKK